VARGAGGLLRAELRPAAGPRFDDAAEAWIPATVRLSVGLSATARSDPFLRAALSVSDRVKPAEGEFDVRIVAGPEPVEMPPGCWILVTPPPSVLGLRPMPVAEISPVWRVSGEHPVTAGVDAAEVQVLGAVPAALPEGVQALLSVPGGGAVAAAGERNGRRFVWIGLDPENSTLPVTGAFPLMIRNALRWFASLRSAPLPPAVDLLEPVRPAVLLPRGLRAVEVLGPEEGAREMVEVAGGSFEFTPAGALEGEVRVRIGAAEHRTRVNAVLPGETEAVPPDEEPAEGPDRSGLRDTEEHLWVWFAAAAAAFLLLEWVVQRTTGH
jgi:hypothetical protein